MVENSVEQKAHARADDWAHSRACELVAQSADYLAGYWADSLGSATAGLLVGQLVDLWAVLKAIWKAASTVAKTAAC